MSGTATDPNSNTSEFSACVTMTFVTPTPTATNTATPTPTFTPTPTPVPAGPLTIDYVYDPLNRLKEANYSTGDFYHYAYDSVGNRLTETTQLATKNYVYDDANRLASVDGTSTGSVFYTFDANGNLLNDGVNTYAYDSANRLISIVNPQSSIENRYNGLGDRLSQNGVNYTLDLNTGLTQVLDDGTTSYTYGLGRISQKQGSTAEYFFGDALGSVRQLTNNAGEITYAKSYDPYGVVTQVSGEGQSAYGYTGEQQSNDMVYLRARFYNPVDGRFLSRDTWGGDDNSPMSFNRWNYTSANPINRVDPSGHCFGGSWWDIFNTPPYLGLCSSSTGQSNIPATSTPLPPAAYTPTCTPTFIPTLPTPTPTTDPVSLTHKDDPFPGTNQKVRFGGELIHSLFIDFQNKDGWWNDNRTVEFGLEEFLGMYLLWESNSNMTLANILVTITAQNLYVGGFNPPACSAGGKCFNAVFNFISANIDGRSALLQGPENEANKRYAIYNPGLGDEAEIRKKISTLGRNALSPSSVISWDRDRGPSSWGNDDSWRKALIKAGIWENRFYEDLSENTVYYYTGNAIYYSVDQWRYWK